MPDHRGTVVITETGQRNAVEWLNSLRQLTPALRCVTAVDASPQDASNMGVRCERETSRGTDRRAGQKVYGRSA